jgi:hypothetical protein
MFLAKGAEEPKQTPVLITTPRQRMWKTKSHLESLQFLSMADLFAVHLSHSQNILHLPSLPFDVREKDPFTPV